MKHPLEAVKGFDQSSLVCLIGNGGRSGHRAACHADLVRGVVDREVNAEGVKQHAVRHAALRPLNFHLRRVAAFVATAPVQAPDVVTERLHHEAFEVVGIAKERRRRRGGWSLSRKELFRLPMRLGADRHCEERVFLRDPRRHAQVLRGNSVVRNIRLHVQHGRSVNEVEPAERDLPCACTAW